MIDELTKNMLGGIKIDDLFGSFGKMDNVAGHHSSQGDCSPRGRRR